MKEKRGKRRVLLHSQRAYRVNRSAPPRTESDLCPTSLSTEKRGYPKPDPDGDHYFVGRLGQTRLSLPEWFTSDHRQFSQSWRTEHAPCIYSFVGQHQRCERTANNVHTQRLVYLTELTLWADIANKVDRGTGLSDSSNVVRGHSK